MSNEKRILCVGMCVLDIIHVCSEFPQEDTDKRCENGYWQRGGNASNNCTVLQKLGAKCEFLGMTSTSPAFQFLYEDCVQRNILIKNCPKTNMDPPFSSVILVNNKGSRTIIHSNPGFPILTYDHFKKVDLSLYSWIHFEGRNIEETVKMMEMIHHYNQTVRDSIMISVELEKLNKNLFTLAMRANVVFIAKDMAEYMGWQSGTATVLTARKLIEDMQIQASEDTNLPFPVPTIISPWGSIESACINSVDHYFTVSALNVEKVVDSLGAGDTFVAGFIYAMDVLKMSVKNAVIYANQLAAFKIQHKGFDAVTNFVYNE